MIRFLWNGAAPITTDNAAYDLVTYLQNGGEFRLPAEGWALVLSALIFLSAAIVFLVSEIKEKNGGKK